MWTRDNLEVLRGLNSESVDLVYLDPPFNSNKNYEAPIGSKAAGAAFQDSWSLSDVDLAWHGEIADREPRVYAAIEAAGVVHGKAMRSYLTMMAVRLLELRRVLKSSGSVYVHCDPTANAYLRVLLDGVFGVSAFRNEIVWCYTGPGNVRRHFKRKHDTILFYANDEAPFNLDAVRVPYSGATLARRLYTEGTRGIAAGASDGRSAEQVRREFGAGKVPEDWWADVRGAGGQMPRKERVGYPTQKPLALLDRIIKASSNRGDLVLDPFCGCATACVSAETLGRQWIGIDLSPVAATLVEQRLRDKFGVAYKAHEIHHRTDVPRRTDLGELPNYWTHKHTLFGRQEAACGGCRMEFPFRNFEVDHVIPRAKGGTDHLDNLQLLCGACNRAKGIGTQAELLAKLRERGVLREAA